MSDCVEVPPRAVSSLIAALEQNDDVKTRVEACAEDLGSIHELATKNMGSLGIEDGDSPVLDTLATTGRVKEEVQQCAEELIQVNENLTQGIDELKRVEVALQRSRKALAKSQAALAISEEDEKLAKMRALYDSLTKLPNRELFEDRLAQGISLAERHDWLLVVMFLDLDSFKSINDTLGHGVGDRVITEVAKRLSNYSRDEDTVCRTGGDEFLYLLVNPPDRETIEQIVDRVATSIARPIDIGTRQLIVTSSIGIAVYPDDGVTGEELIRHADIAMYHARRHKMPWSFFNAVEERRTA